MSQTIYCDLCDMPIKGTRHLLAMLKDIVGVDEAGRSVEVYSARDLAHYLDDYKNASRRVEKRELCDKCYGILMMFFTERKKVLKQATAEIKKLYDLIGKKSPTDK